MGSEQCSTTKKLANTAILPKKFPNTAILQCQVETCALPKQLPCILKVLIKSLREQLRIVNEC